MWRWFSKLVSRMKKTTFSRDWRKDDESIKYGRFHFGKDNWPKSGSSYTCQKSLQAVTATVSWWILNIYESRYGCWMTIRLLLMFFEENKTSWHNLASWRKREILVAEWSAQMCSAATVSLEMNNFHISHCHSRITVEQVGSFPFLVHLSKEFSFVKGNTLFPPRLFSRGGQLSAGT